MSPRRMVILYGLDKPQEKIALLGKDLDQTLLVGKSEEKVGKPGSAPNRYVRVQGQRHRLSG